MSWVAVGAAAVSVAGSLYSSNQQSKAAKGAANAQQRASDQANDTQLQMYNQSREDSLPWLNTGAAALNKLGALYGLNVAPSVAAPTSAGASPAGQTATPSNGVGPVGYETARPYTGALPGQTVGNALAGGSQAAAPAAANSPDYSDFYNSPDYQFALQQGTQNLDRSAASRGRLYSGGYGQDLVSFGQGLASQQLNTYTNRLANIAGLGQTAGGDLNRLGANYANQYGNNLDNAAASRASGYAGQANAATGLANGLGMAAGYYGQYQQNKNGWIPPIDNSSYATDNPYQF